MMMINVINPTQNVRKVRFHKWKFTLSSCKSLMRGRTTAWQQPSCFTSIYQNMAIIHNMILYQLPHREVLLKVYMQTFMAVVLFCISACCQPTVNMVDWQDISHLVKYSMCLNTHHTDVWTLDGLGTESSEREGPTIRTLLKVNIVLSTVRCLFLLRH